MDEQNTLIKGITYLLPRADLGGVYFDRAGWVLARQAMTGTSSR